MFSGTHLISLDLELLLRTDQNQEERFYLSPAQFMTPSDLLHRPYSTPSLFYKCRKKLHWDDIIPEDIMHRWQAWLQELPKQVATDRSFKPPNLGEVTSTQLHHFSDVSHQGYATVTYLRFTDCSGNTKCSFVMGKSRLEPMKSVTVPRMELSAAVVATTLETMSCEELSLPISELFFWTDSTCITLKIKTNDFKHLWQIK